MEILKPDLDLDGFFARLPGAPGKALMLDYDGTLAPFRVERGQAAPYPGVREALAGLVQAGRGRVVIVSGRAVADLAPLLGLAVPPEMWGCHGWERQAADGGYTFFSPGNAALEGLSRAAGAVENGGSGRVERKPASVAYHVRGMEAGPAAEALAAVRRAWQPIAAAGGLTLVPFDGGLELRVPGRDKGVAVAALRNELGEGGVVAYLGDDQTDEDAFHAVGPEGLAVLVRTEKRPTAAALWLRPPGELLAFLHRWERAW